MHGKQNWISIVYDCTVLQMYFFIVYIEYTVNV